MSILLVALDNSSAAGPVLETARLVAPLLDAQVRAIHVREDNARVARSTAAAAGVPLSEVAGDPVECIVEAASDPEVVAVAVGLRGRPMGRRPAGHVAVEVMTRVDTSVLVVPPDARPGSSLHRVLVPLDGTAATARRLHRAVELARGASLEIIVVHVSDEDSIPMFSDQPQYETDVWAEEFLARYCPAAPPDVHLELRVGVPAEQVAEVGSRLAPDLVLMGWSRSFDAGHAETVRQTLARCPSPVLLLPLDHRNAS